MHAIFKRTFSNISIPEVCLNVIELIQTSTYACPFFLQKKYYIFKNKTIPQNASFLMLLKKYLTLFPE